MQQLYLKKGVGLVLRVSLFLRDHKFPHGIPMCSACVRREMTLIGNARQARSGGKSGPVETGNMVYSDYEKPCVLFAQGHPTMMKHLPSI